ncbi:hypothetical protein HK099_002546 [Clydaea vesicula]|uniref:Amino acid transporter transmembrane domain-containing protein n=1 Tax=Clydaea vesicula TaxID=447962 RepID=A0AAD5U2J6_9FUNG|nr:hypothetical protein HK099_002546 [Clydaea vesicula]
MGSSVLSVPFAFKLSGWYFALTLLSIFALSNLYSSLVLEKVMKTANSNSFVDIAKIAFGRKGFGFATIVFCLDLFFCGAMYVVLIADSLVSLYPSFLNATYVKTILVVTLVPFTWFKRLSVLAYSSFLGIVAIINIMAILIFDGVTSDIVGSSLFFVSETATLPPSLFEFPQSFGLLFSGFVCSTLLPSLYSEMKNKKDYKNMIKFSYIFVFLFSLAWGILGYLMFGSHVLPAVSENMTRNVNYDQVLNRVALWFLIVSLVTKYPIIMNALNLNLGFNNIVSLLGSFICIAVAIIVPCLCHLKLHGGFDTRSNELRPVLNKSMYKISFTEKILCLVLVVCGSIMGIIGTIWSFFPIN